MTEGASFLPVLGSLGVAFRRSGSHSGEIVLCCPFCTDRGESKDTRFRLGLNFRSGKAHCFNCGWKSRHGPQEVLRFYGLEMAFPEEQVKEASGLGEVRLPDGFERLSTKGGRALVDAWRYLRYRGVTAQQVKELKVGATLVGKFTHRVVFPVAFQNKLFGYVGRDYTGRREPKYLNSSGIKSLYNLDSALGAKVVVLSEGIFKALAIERVAPGWGSIALLGHSLSDFQKCQLQDNCLAKELVVWPDPDSVGIRSGASLASALVQMGYRVSVVFPVKRQADEYSEFAIEHLLEDRKRFDWELHSRMVLASAILNFGR